MKAYAFYEGGWGTCSCGRIGSWEICMNCDVEVPSKPDHYKELICKRCIKNYSFCRCHDKKERTEMLNVVLR